MLRRTIFTDVLSAFMLSIVMLNLVMLNDVILNVIILNVVILNVVMLSVRVPFVYLQVAKKIYNSIFEIFLL